MMTPAKPPGPAAHAHRQMMANWLVSVATEALSSGCTSAALKRRMNSVAVSFQPTPIVVPDSATSGSGSVPAESTTTASCIDGVAALENRDSNTAFEVVPLS